MRYSNLLIIIFCSLLLTFTNSPGYCFFRDDMDHERVVKEVEEMREESQERFEQNQEKRDLELREKKRIQEELSMDAEQREKIPAQTKPKIGWVILLISSLGLGAYLFYRRKT